MLALNFMHSQNIIYRDLKPENILCEDVHKLDSSDDVHVKIADFGLAIKTQQGQRVRSLAGTYMYMAPEQFSGVAYDSKVDIWALGIIAFNLVSGSFPFDWDRRLQKKEAMKRLADSIRFEQPKLDLLRGVSGLAQAFVTSLLTKCAAERPSAAELLEHPWMQTLRQSEHVLKAKQIEIGYNLLQFEKTTNA